MGAIFDSGAVGVAFATADGRLVEANRSVSDLTGYSGSELVGRPFIDLAHPDDRAEFLAGLERLLGGEIASFEMTGRFLGKDGGAVWARSHVFGAGGTPGKPEQLVVVVQDITRWRWAEEQNAQLFGFPLCLIFIAGMDGYFKRVSAGYERLLGWSEEELLARPYLEFVHPDDIGALAASLEEVAAGREEVINQEIRILCKDGSYRWLIGNYRPVPEEGVMYGVAVDLTERKQLEETLARRSADLEAVNRELEGFSYSVSHDLRAPLRAIDGFSRILLEKHAAELSGEAERYLRLVRSSTERMGQLIDDLLAFARLGRQPLMRRQASPGELVRQVVEELQGEFADRRVEIAVGDLPVCSADPALLRQVFVNLLANAVKFTRSREVARIEVGSQRDADAAGELVYFVSDNGTGFDMRYADKLFGVFQRLHHEEEYEGTGVGLATVERIVHRHGGRIWAEAEPGKGATFSFTLGSGRDE
jgi:PAS domain S-box-containing protein